MKFRITDENGETCEVEEAEEKVYDDDTEAPAEVLTADEIRALKSLASVADKLMSLVKEDVAETTDDDEELGPDIDADKEEVVDTDEDKDEKEDKDDIHDSIGFIGRSKSTNDSINVQDDIAAAWAKRYGGKN